MVIARFIWRSLILTDCSDALRDPTTSAARKKDLEKQAVLLLASAVPYRPAQHDVSSLQNA